MHKRYANDFFPEDFTPTADYPGVAVYLASDVDARIAEIHKALEPFAAMDRPGGDLKELACKRGIASDMTILTSADFRRAAEAIKSLMGR